MVKQRNLIKIRYQDWIVLTLGSLKVWGTTDHYVTMAVLCLARSCLYFPKYATFWEAKFHFVLLTACLFSWLNCKRKKTISALLVDPLSSPLDILLSIGSVLKKMLRLKTNKQANKSNAWHIGKTIASQPEWNSLRIPILGHIDKNSAEIHLHIAFACWLEETSSMRKVWRKHFDVWIYMHEL